MPEHYTGNIRTIENNPSYFIWIKMNLIRVISHLSGEKWFLQIEHELPQRIEKNKNMYIQKEIWHRVFCTNNDEQNSLVITIQDFKPQC